MKNTSGVILEPENYCMLIATLMENGCFRYACSCSTRSHSKSMEYVFSLNNLFPNDV